MGHTPEKVVAKLDREGEVRHDQEDSVRNFGQDPEGGTTSVVHEEESTKSGYLKFESGGMPTINWRKIGGQVSEYIRSLRGEPSSEPGHKQNGS